MSHAAQFPGRLPPCSVCWQSRSLAAQGAFGDTIATVASAGSIPSDAAVKPGEFGFEEIVFVKRKPYSSDHYYTDINSGTSPRPLPCRQRHLRLQPAHAIGAARSSRPPTCRAARASSARSACRSMPQRSSSISARIPGPDSASGKCTPTARASARYRSRRPTRPRRRNAGTRAGTRTTSIPVICKTARSSSPRPAASIRSCAAGPHTSWPRAAPHGRRRRPRRTAYQQSCQRILPACSSTTAA